MRFITVKDNDGELRPMAFLWRKDDNLKYNLPEIEKANKKGDVTLVEIEIKEIKEFKI